MNKLELTQQENEPSLNIKSCLIISSSLARVSKKNQINKFKHLILSSAQFVYNPTTHPENIHKFS